MKITSKANYLSAVGFLIYLLFLLLMIGTSSNVFIGVGLIICIIGLTFKKPIILLIGFIAQMLSTVLFSYYFDIFRFLSELSAFIITLFVIINNDNLKEFVKKIWFVPAVVSFIPALPNLMDIIYDFDDILFYIIYSLSLLFGCFWLAFPQGLSIRETFKYNENETFSQNPSGIGNGYISLTKHILLLFFTCGIWYFIWIYRTTDYLNNVKYEEYRDPTKKLLLCIFVPFYTIYWVYKSAQRIDKLASVKNMESDLSTLCLILAIFIGIIPPIIMQSKINDISTYRKHSFNSSNADEIKKYKDLLDSGVITQEEFDSKKSQLLDL